MLKIKNKMNFNKIQKEVLIGILLGSGHLEQMPKVTYRLKIEQSNVKPILKVKINGNKSLFF